MAIQSPRSLDYRSVLKFALRLLTLPEQTEYCFDFERLGHVEPFGMLFASALLRQFKSQRAERQANDCTFRVIGHTKNEYASHMGFYQSFGCNYGKKPGEAAGSSRYIPITSLPVEEVRAKSSAELKHYGVVLEDESSRIARILVQEQEGDLVDALTYCFREIFRNIVEHSEADTIWYAAQCWPTKNQVELSILDEGVGIRKSLSGNPNLKIIDDANAIHLSVQPGISGKAFTFKAGGRKRKSYNTNDEWRNSGYGLYMTSGLCRAGGSFLICSGDRALVMEGDHASLISTSFRGTALRLVMRTDDLPKLDSLRLEGQEHARASSLPGNFTASMITRMLARDILKLRDRAE